MKSTWSIPIIAKPSDSSFDQIGPGSGIGVNTIATSVERKSVDF